MRCMEGMQCIVLLQVDGIKEFAVSQLRLLGRVFKLSSNEPEGLRCGDCTPKAKPEPRTALDTSKSHNSALKFSFLGLLYLDFCSFLILFLEFNEWNFN